MNPMFAIAASLAGVPGFGIVLALLLAVAGVGYLGQGRGIVRYLWVLGDRWVSLDSTEWSHYDDLGVAGGPVLFDGDTAGDRIVRSVRPR